MIHNIDNFWQYTNTIDGWFHESEAKLLYLCASSVPTNQAIVEIGAYKGRSTSILAFGTRGAPIYSIDPHNNEIAFVEQGIVYSSYDEYCANLDRLGITETLVKRIVGYSYDVAEVYDGPPVGLLFIDGYHSPEAVMKDFYSWERHLAKDAIVYFDDSNHGGVIPGLQQIYDAGKLPTIHKNADKSTAFLNQINIDRQPLLNNY